MRWIDFFRKKRNVTDSPIDQTGITPSGDQQALEKISSDVENLRAQVNTVNIALKKHDEELTEHRKLIQEHSERFEKLEIKVSPVQITPAVKEAAPTVRPIQTPYLSAAPTPATSYSPQKFDINRFSEQQKRILAVFFQNQDMALSYADIGRILNKSPLTVKNQMREIRFKADLFDRAVGEQSRHRFKLKKDLRIEKYLNVG